MTCSPARACSRVSGSHFAEPAGTKFQQLGSHRPAARLAPIARLLRNEFPVPSFFSARSRHYSNIGQSIFFGLMLWALASRCPHPSDRVMPAAGRVSPQRPAAPRFWFYAMADRCDLCRDRHVRTARLEIRTASDIAPAFETLKDRADAIYVVTDPLVIASRIRINTFALGARLPTMHGFREGVEAAGLISYGPNFPDQFRRAAEYVDKILRGAKPADLPVEQPTKFDLIINLTTARALGLDVPP